MLYVDVKPDITLGFVPGEKIGTVEVVYRFSFVGLPTHEDLASGHAITSLASAGRIVAETVLNGQPWAAI